MNLIGTTIQWLSHCEHPFQEILSLHGNNLDALAAMDSGSSDPLQHFRFCDIFKIRVLHPFLVILVLMFVLQFCGQGVITFYTVQIFKVRMWIPIGSDENYCPGLLQYCRVLSIIAQDACSIVEAKDCALVIGVTYFLSALLRCLWSQWQWWHQPLCYWYVTSSAWRR